RACLPAPRQSGRSKGAACGFPLSEERRPLPQPGTRGTWPHSAVKAVLPEQLQSKLNNTPVGSGPDTAECTGIDLRLDLRKVYLVERIEELGSKLQAHRLANRKIFQQTQVRAVHRGAADQPSAGIPVRAARNLIGWHERSRIEEAVYHGTAAGMIELNVGPSDPGHELSVLITERAIERYVVSLSKRERRAALNRVNTGERPASEEALRHTVCEMHRRRPQPRCHEGMTAVPIRTAA